MALTADRRDYKRAFQRHLHVYRNWKIHDHTVTKELILAYIVECGLKYLIMENYQLFVVQEANSDLSKVLGSHDFKKMLKEVGWNNYRLIPFKTKHGETVEPERYHEFCRYALEAENVEKPVEFNDRLKEIVDELEAVIK